MKWIKFQEARNTGKTKIWDVVTKDGATLLGQIKWYSPWRKYSFFPSENTVSEPTCLKDIASFIEGEMYERKMRKL